MTVLLTSEYAQQGLGDKAVTFDDIEEFQGPGVSNYDLEGNQEPLTNLSPMSTRVEDTNPKVTRVEDTNPPQAQPHVTEQTTARPAAVGTNEMREFTEDDLMRATENFSPDRKLWQGGFGTVFRGYINGTNVAVKKLTNGRAVTEAVQKGVTVPEQYTVDGQVNCEMWALTRCRHKNLVDLAGYCSTPPMLVYEYMKEGNLYCRMFKAKRLALSWRQRSCILKDVCRGLSWLHAVTPPVIHGDIKMTNILLDRHLTAKLGDFGFSQEFAQIVRDRSAITFAVVAKSLGYSPPEMDMCHVSPKSDVYSYGVLAMELFTGKKAYSKEREDPKLTDFYDEQRKSLQGYNTIADKEAGDVAPYLLQIYRNVIEGCLLKHSKRVSSAKIMEMWETTNF